MSRVLPLLPSIPFAVLGVKRWLFPGWTWKGVFLTPEGLASVFGVIVVLSAGLWTISRLSVRRGITIGWKSAFLFWCLMIGSLAFSDEREPFENLLRLCDDGNWTYARKEIESLKQSPFRPGLLMTLTLYVEAHDMTSADTANESTGVREMRSAIKKLLDEGENHKFLNTLSYAELSKYLYFKEGKSDPTIMEGIQLLRDSLQSLRNPSDKGPILLKEGELLLAKQDYTGAIQALDGAAATLRTSPSKARALANWSTCSVPLLDWTGDKLSKLIQDQAHIHPAQMLCEGAAQVSSSVARRGRSVAATELLRGRRPIPLVTVHLQPGDPCHE